MKKRIIKSNARNEKKERREQVLGTKIRQRKKEGRQGMKETVRSDTDRRRETWDCVVNTEEQCDAEAGTSL